MYPRPRLVSSLVAALAVVVCASPAGAELVYFSNGRTMSVKGHRADGTSLVLALRGGGEIVCESSMVSRIEPDEVPYPEELPAEVAALPSPGNREAPASPWEASALVTDPRFDSMIETASARNGVDATLVRAVIQVESNYQQRARSPKGAKGLMQLMPSTARQYGLMNPYDPASNIDAGTRHLKSLLERFPLKLALAAYNAGEAAVERFGGVPPFAETRLYVERILKLLGRA